MKKRLDQIVVERGLAPSRDAARRLILAGLIRVGGEVRDKAGRLYDTKLPVEVVGPANPYVGRGGLKLEHALDAFGVDVPGDGPLLDIGASTGGFTDCLLQRGASEVVAVDAGRAQLHEKLRADPRVRVMEKTNARFLTLDAIGGRPSPLIVIDVSFISLRLILPVCADMLAADGRAVALIKPQFEAGRGEVGSGGIVRDPAVHRRVLEDLAGFFRETGWRLLGLTASPIRGGDGNVEFFALLDRGAPPASPEGNREMIDAALPPSYGAAPSGDEKPVESP
jgi:23S rRNA (cytidine1920-2'-O)/16S rRNA (cytidine1409-2'-O)-methyltransferase